MPTTISYVSRRQTLSYLDLALTSVFLTVGLILLPRLSGIGLDILQALLMAG